MKQKRLETNIAIVLIAEKKSVVPPEAIFLNLTYRKDNLKKKKSFGKKWWHTWAFAEKNLLPCVRN